MSGAERGNSGTEQSITLSNPVNDAVKRLSESTGASAFKIANQLISDAAYLRERVESGGEILIRESDGKLYRITLPPIEAEPGPNVIQLQFPKGG